MVVNDSRVIPARLRLRRDSGGAAEVLLLEQHDANVWEALVRPGKKVKPGETLYTESGQPIAQMGVRTKAGDTFMVTLLSDDPFALLEEHGEMPLPPYISAPLHEHERYQTVYANEPGSAAAPTAGLHFTSELLHALESRGVTVAKVQLVVGLDTFQPMSVENPLDHPIHSERYVVPADTMAHCREATRVIAVGTTATRALESAATFGELQGRTRLFIHRGYNWKVVDLMLTNFHLPRTTLLLMVESFIGPRWRMLYETALAENYRFLSFGDAMLLDRSL